MLRRPWPWRHRRAGKAPAGPVAGVRRPTSPVAAASEPGRFHRITTRRANSELRGCRPDPASPADLPERRRWAEAAIDSRRVRRKSKAFLWGKITGRPAAKPTSQGSPTTFQGCVVETRISWRPHGDQDRWRLDSARHGGPRRVDFRGDRANRAQGTSQRRRVVPGSARRLTWLILRGTSPPGRGLQSLTAAANQEVVCLLYPESSNCSRGAVGPPRSSLVA